MGERPESQFFFRQAPELRDAVRLEDEEGHDQRAHDDKLEVRGEVIRRSEGPVVLGLGETA